MEKVVEERIYANLGNLPLVELLGQAHRVLDIGCGAGDNAVLMKERKPDVVVCGLTLSEQEAEIARKHMDACWVADIEEEVPIGIFNPPFDTFVFSHVLEHLRQPERVLKRFIKQLPRGGQVLIAVPNVLNWRQRIEFLLGRFQYAEVGVLDNTHLRFFTYFSTDEYLLSECPELEVVYKGVDGSVPLWWLRRHFLPKQWCKAIDKAGCRRWPNLFGGQVLIKIVKR